MKKRIVLWVLMGAWITSLNLLGAEVSTKFPVTKAACVSLKADLQIFTGDPTKPDLNILIKNFQTIRENAKGTSMTIKLDDKSKGVFVLMFNGEKLEVNPVSKTSSCALNINWATKGSVVLTGDCKDLIPADKNASLAEREEKAKSFSIQEPITVACDLG